MNHQSESQVFDEPVFTASEIAKAIKQHRVTVQRRFIDEPGVIRLGHPARRGKRQCFTLRIPLSVVQRVYGSMTVGA